MIYLFSGTVRLGRLCYHTTPFEELLIQLDKPVKKCPANQEEEVIDSGNAYYLRHPGPGVTVLVRDPAVSPGNHGDVKDEWNEAEHKMNLGPECRSEHLRNKDTRFLN